MPRIEVYSSLSRDQAIDVEGRHVSHPRLRAMHLAMVPLLQVMNVVHWAPRNLDDHQEKRLVLQQGQAVAHRDMVPRFRELFAAWCDLKFPIQHFIPISQAPDSQDNYAMAQNWSLIYRPDVIGGSDDPDASFSEHFRGSAIDINQLQNPIINPDFTIEPPEAIGHEARLDMVLLRRVDDVVRVALDLDFEWGNDWPDPRAGSRFYGIRQSGEWRQILRDSHHFELVPELAAALEMPEFPWPES